VQRFLSQSYTYAQRAINITEPMRAATPAQDSTDIPIIEEAQLMNRPTTVLSLISVTDSFSKVVVVNSSKTGKVLFTSILSSNGLGI